MHRGIVPTIFPFSKSYLADQPGCHPRKQREGRRTERAPPPILEAVLKFGGWEVRQNFLLGAKQKWLKPNLPIWNEKWLLWPLPREEFHQHLPPDCLPLQNRALGKGGGTAPHSHRQQMGALMAEGWKQQRGEQDRQNSHLKCQLQARAEVMPPSLWHLGTDGGNHWEPVHFGG